MYSVTSIKTFRGMEGDGFNATLLRDGKKVAMVIDDASGGPMQYHWNDESAPKVQIVGEHGTYKGSPEEKLLVEHCGKLPHQRVYEMHMTVSPDIFVSHLLDLHTTAKKLAGKAVIWASKGKKGAYTLKGAAKYTPEQQRKIILERNPGAVFLATLPLEQAHAIMTGEKVA